MKAFDVDCKKLFDEIDNLKSQYYNLELVVQYKDKEDFKKMKKDSKIKKIKKDYEKATDLQRQFQDINKLLEATKSLNEESEKYHYYS